MYNSECHETHNGIARLYAAPILELQRAQTMFPKIHDREYHLSIPPETDQLYAERTTLTSMKMYEPITIGNKTPDVTPEQAIMAQIARVQGLIH